MNSAPVWSIRGLNFTVVLHSPVPIHAGYLTAHPCLVNNVGVSTPSAFAKASTTPSVTFLPRRSTRLINVRCKPACSASRSCDNPCSFRNRIMFSLKIPSSSGLHCIFLLVCRSSAKAINRVKWFRLFHSSEDY